LPGNLLGSLSLQSPLLEEVLFPAVQRLGLSFGPATKRVGALYLMFALA
jgi:hypothetical protein